MYHMRRLKTGRLIVLIAIPFLCAIVFVLMLSGLRPVILQYAENYMVHEASFALYKVMTDTVYQNRAEYENLVRLERDEQQAVTALRTDGITASYLKVEIAQAVHEAIDQLEKSQIEIPLGTLLGSDWFAGQGPLVQVGVSGLGNVDADFISAFHGAGINQTRHQMILEVTANIQILTRLGSVDTQVKSQIPVSDTVIVGHVPEQYTYVDDTEDDLLGKINDYAR
ncbi:MAG: sporulation protein YunB [Butyricicoccus pullicaecorum]|nr:sporulation protein YunB [Butyricicoccus pullicaecorum]MDO4669549.1 sporulation protein YunB [Butyricicoccus pullicaecorum]